MMWASASMIGTVYLLGVALSVSAWVRAAWLRMGAAAKLAEKDPVIKRTRYEVTFWLGNSLSIAASPTQLGYHPWRDTAEG